MTYLDSPTRVEIRPGEGGDDACEFAGELVSALSACVRRTGNQLRVSTSGRTTTLHITGEGAAHCAALAGTHRVQRIPVNDRAGRRHTSSATIAVLGEAEQGRVTLDERDLRVDYYRGSGKGGQHRNTRDTAVRLVHGPTGITVVVEQGRKREQNLGSARAELVRRLGELNGAIRREEINDSRVAQIGPGTRGAKQWTWNYQRGDVVNHETGETYALGELVRGRFEAVVTR